MGCLVDVGAPAVAFEVQHRGRLTAAGPPRHATVVANIDVDPVVRRCRSLFGKRPAPYR